MTAKVRKYFLRVVLFIVVPAELASNYIALKLDT